MRRALLVVSQSALGGCAADEPVVPEPPLEPLFAFAVLAAPHIVNDVEREARLAAAVAWIDAVPHDPPIELVLVLGDIGWGGGLARAKALLDELSVPYVPLVGDNEIHEGDDDTFATVFEPRYAALATELEGFRRAPVPVAHPTSAEPAWLENAAFEHRGVRFFALDWCVRGVAGALGEFGDLHDFTGGTLPWLAGELPAPADALPGSIVLASHIPTFLGLFDHAEMDALTALFAPLDAAIYAAIAGHLHGNLTMDGPGHPALATDAVFEDQVTVRRFDVLGNGARFAYVDELVVVPFP
ncbi:MAG: hypothetical protein HY908_08200 [Myxococcales bacterium]|nr:hypothetical protein [Myxococcales bacterium]